MPCVGALCELTREPVTWKDCLGCARAKHLCHFTPELLCALAPDPEDRRDAGISITMLTGCLRKSYFELTRDYHQRPTCLYPASRGTAFHAWLEGYPLPDRVYETRFARDIVLPDGRVVRLSGKMDVLDPIERLIIDYKSKREDRVPVCPADVDRAYIWQLNGYRLILAEGIVVSPSEFGIRLQAGERVEYPVDRLGLVYLTMSGPTKLPVPVLPLLEVNDYFLPRLASLDRALTLGPPPARDVPDPQGSVFCREWCPFQAECLRT
jgi:hypothetical protein